MYVVRVKIDFSIKHTARSQRHDVDNVPTTPLQPFGLVKGLLKGL